MTMGPPPPMENGIAGPSSSRTEASRESTPDELENSHHDVSSKASADSLESSLTPGSIGRSSTTDSGVDALASPHAPFLQTRDSIIKSVMPPLPMVFSPQKQWPDVLILPNDDSSDNDSYYEDIDALDKGRSYKGSAAYLDPKSHRSMDRGRVSISVAPRSSSMKKHLEDRELQGPAFLKAGELVIADKGIVCDISEPVKEEMEEEDEVEGNKDDAEDTNNASEEDDEKGKLHRSPSVKKTVAALEAAAKALIEPPRAEESKPSNKKVERAVKQKAILADL